MIKGVIENKEKSGRAVTEIVDAIHRYDGVNYSLNKAKAYIDEGKGFLEAFADSDPKESLRAISDYIIKRKL
jgi:geranylgeranyl pyrophosphate synthase